MFGGQELEDDGGGLLIGADEQSLKDLQHCCAAVAIAEGGVQEFVEVAGAWAVDAGESGELLGELADVGCCGGGEFGVATIGVFLQQFGLFPGDDDEFVTSEVSSGLLKLENIGVLRWKEGFDGLIEVELPGDGEGDSGDQQCGREQ